MDQSRLDKADQLRYEGDYEQARTLYDQLLEESPDDPERYLVLMGRGLAYEFDGYFDEAIADLEAMRALKPDYVKGLEHLFKTYLMLGMNDEALAEMRHVRDLEPGNEEVAKAAIYFPEF